MKEPTWKEAMKIAHAQTRKKTSANVKGDDRSLRRERR